MAIIPNKSDLRREDLFGCMLLEDSDHGCLLPCILHRTQCVVEHVVVNISIYHSRQEAESKGPDISIKAHS